MVGLGILTILWFVSISIEAVAVLFGGIGLATEVVAFYNFVTIIISVILFGISLLASIKGMNYEAVFFPIIGKMAANISKLNEDENNSIKISIQSKVDEVKQEENIEN